MTASKGGASDSMGEGLWLGLCAGGSGQSCLGFAGRFGMGEEADFIGDGASKVVEGLADVRRVVIGFVRVLRASKMSVRSQGESVGVV